MSKKQYMILKIGVLSIIGGLFIWLSFFINTFVSKGLLESNSDLSKMSCYSISFCLTVLTTMVLMSPIFILSDVYETRYAIKYPTLFKVVYFFSFKEWQQDKYILSDLVTYKHVKFTLFNFADNVYSVTFASYPLLKRFGTFLIGNYGQELSKLDLLYETTKGNSGALEVLSSELENLLNKGSFEFLKVLASENPKELENISCKLYTGELTMDSEKLIIAFSNKSSLKVSAYDMLPNINTSKTMDDFKHACVNQTYQTKLKVKQDKEQGIVSKEKLKQEQIQSAKDMLASLD